MITFNIINKNIAGSVNGKPFNTPYSKELWDKLVDAQKEYAKASDAKSAKAVLESFEKLVQGQTHDEAIQEITPYIKYSPKKGTYHLHDPEEDKTSVIPLPEILIDKMKYAHDEELPVDPLVKFTIRTLRNRNVINATDATEFIRLVCQYAFKTFTSPVLLEQYLEQGYTEQVAEELATVYQTPITMEGLLSTKKVATPLYDRQRYKFEYDEDGNPRKVLRDGVNKELNEDTGEETIEDPQYAEDWVFQPAIMGTGGDAFFCGSEDDAPKGHIMRVGQEMRLERWDQVDWSPHRTFVKGLHAGNQDYINHYESQGNVTLDCLIDPSKMVVPYDTSDGAIRCKEMMIVGIKDRSIENKNLYHSSEYAKLQDERWDEYRKELLAKFDEDEKEFLKKLEERKEKLG